MNQNDQEFIYALADSFRQDRLEHSGVKGMKWGHRRARNAAALGNAHLQNTTIRAGVVGGKIRGKAESVASKISGSNSKNIVRRLAGTAVHNNAKKGTYAGAVNVAIAKRRADKSVNKALARNSKQTAKLANRVSSKSGKAKAKAQKNLEAWNAYSKSFEKKAKATQGVTSSKFKQNIANVKNNRSIHDKSNNIHGPKALQKVTRSAADASINGATKKLIGAYTGGYKGAKKALKRK